MQKPRTLKPDMEGNGDSRYRPFDNIINFRDVGALVNRLCGSRIMKERVLYRSATPDNASSRDKQRLVEDMGLATIIDLRSNDEHRKAANKHLAASVDVQQTASPPQSTTADEHLVHLPGVNRITISLIGWAVQKLLIWRLSWYNMLKLFSLLTTGYRTDALKLLTGQVMQPRGLIGLAHDTLTASTAEIVEVLTYLAQPDTYPVLIHCSQGKDRTGLVVALVLLLLSEESDLEEAGGKGGVSVVPLSAMRADYELSGPGLEAERGEWLREIEKMGMGPEFAACAPGFVEEVKRFLDERYGGVRGYLLSLGVREEVLEGVRAVLLEIPEDVP